jgi:pimeloyl-ACP methyl ester carboxylesterase
MMVAIDARGYSRSVLDGVTPEQQRVEVQSDDAYRLLRHLTDEPAYVVGGSDGAIVGLDLLARHPGRIARLLAYEPPCFAILPDAADQRAFVEEAYILARTEGIAAASARFLAGIGGATKPAPDPGEFTSHTAALWQRLAANAPIMMEYELREFTSYIPDCAALAAARERLVLGVGRESRGCLPSRPAAEIAARTGLEVSEFPGMHNGMRTAAKEFAPQVIEMFGG